ncbi:membrane protein insertase YidC [Desulfobacter sp. UBA2225]|jgi:YidC/Oxa1 family membrane protein insertase|uniref:membrane protein insertase YidC n=1 Tax=Desulfobacter sp. UBA2225 TaxID=1961413 RepID=UPI00257BB1AC|nr:membrane protein insertase YidC [Desulfobacter sp. UBA2225]
MDEQKRLFLAVALSVVVLFGYQFFFAPAPQPDNQNQEAPLQTMDSPVSDSAKVSNVTPEAVPAPVPGNQAGLRDFRTITVSTPYYTIGVSEHKAAVTSLTLNDYRETNDEGSPAKQLVTKEVADLTGGIFSINTAQGSIRGLADAVFSSDADSKDISLNQGEKNITFSWTNPDGITVKKVLTFKADSYLIHCNIIVQNGSDIPVNDAISISVPGHFDEEVNQRSRFAFEGPVAYLDNKFTTIKPKDIEDKDTYSGVVGWVGYTTRYFLTAVMPDTPETSTLKLSFANDVVTNRLVSQMPRLDPDKQNQLSFTLYMGPKSHKILSQYDNLLKKSVNFGFFDILATPLLIAMNFIHDILPNYGVAIILLTIFIKLIFWPLGTKSYKSMNEMKKVQPLMMQIREKYKNDKQRMNQEIMGLYKTYKVNPASGCLPLLVQMPIFFALYRMLYMAIELRHAPFVGWIQDLSGPDRLFHFNFSIPFMDAPYGIPVLTLLMGASFLLQQKMTPTAGDPMQAKMMMLMPIFMTVLFINFPAGLVLYMFVNNIISMGQQYYTQKILA